MQGAINADAPLDYAAFQILPTQNRYEAFVCCDGKIEKLPPGLLEHLVLHLPEVNNFHPEESNDNFILQLPENLRGAAWFTKSTLSRFLHIIGAYELLKIANVIRDEMSQLEEARRFHLALYAQGHQDHLASGQTDSCNSKDTELAQKPDHQTASSDATKNELLRAMDLRLAALGEEFAAAFNRAADATCSTKQIADLVAFSQHFGAIDLSNSLFKYLTLSRKNKAADHRNEQSNHSHESRNDNGKVTDGITQVCSPASTVMPIKYGASPAKVAQVERQSSTESEESSNSSDEDRSFTERSRPLIRSASPRRSASPMRRIQIGRTGSRRATALTIKSLSFIPARERVSSNRDSVGSGSENEESDKPPKKSENNIRRMSVQDAINLFESKQRDQNLEIQKKRSSMDTSVGANKSVLRRWSAGMGDSSSQCPSENAFEDAIQITPNILDVGEIQKNSEEAKPESDFIPGSPNLVKTAELSMSFAGGEKKQSYAIDDQADTVVTQAEETHDRVTASVEWNRQKEAELNQMMMKMMESKPVRYRNMATGNNKSLEFPSEQSGSLYDHYKQKRDEELRQEKSGKRAEKEQQFKALQEILDQRKVEMGSKNVGIAGKQDSLGRSQRSQKNSSPSVQPKRETSKPAISRKASPKTSSLPATRKSWPSAPSPKTASPSPIRTPNVVSSAGTTPTRRKSQPTPLPNRSSTKIERSQKQQKGVKANPMEIKPSLKSQEAKKVQAMKKSGNVTKRNPLPASGDSSAIVSAKPSFYNKVTKKGSVVPLESKPFLRKGSRIGPGVGSVVAKKKGSQSDESLRNSGNLIQAQEEVVVETAEPETQQQEVDPVPMVSDVVDLEPEAQLNNHQKCENTENYGQFVSEGDDSFKKSEEFPIEIQSDEVSAISPAAWVEIEEHHQELPVYESGPPQIANPANNAPVVLSSPRVRHSLSQMLQEDNGEPEIIEWGNAENPPSIVYQKDVPKGLKRLLKFARKSKGEANVTGWSSPSVFSEGEEDSEEPKAASKRNADALLRKAALQAKGFGQQKTSFGESFDGGNSSKKAIDYTVAHTLPAAQSNISKFTGQSSHKLQEGHISAASTSTKARSFFSLSTFRSNKSTETKLR